MRQLIPFDPAKGGSTPNYCLQNTRLGYGIPALYNSAMEAWSHTEQHPNRDFPQLDVPIYFSYIATLNGATANYGHIGVGLKNGQFWSDGKIYSSLEAYEKNHAPKFLGWGESVNNVKVIDKLGANMDAATRQDVTDIYQVVIGRDPVESEYAWVNQPHMVIVNALRNDANQQRATANQTIIDLQKQVDAGSGEFVETKVYIKKG